MATTIIWATVVLVMFGIAAWRTESITRSYLRATAKDPAIANEERAIALIERRTAAEIEAGTAAETIALRQAQLNRERAETDLAAQRAAALQEEQLEADKSVIEARREAQCKLAAEFAREDHRGKLSPKEMIDLYGAHLRTLELYDIDSHPSLATFAATVATLSA